MAFTLQTLNFYSISILFTSKRLLRASSIFFENAIWRRVDFPRVGPENPYIFVLYFSAFTLDDYHDYQKHFTVMNYVEGGSQLKQVR